MFVGIGIFSIFTANVASFFVRNEQTGDGATHPVVADEVRLLRSQIADLQATIERTNGTTPDNPA